MSLQQSTENVDPNIIVNDNDKDNELIDFTSLFKTKQMGSVRQNKKQQISKQNEQNNNVINVVNIVPTVSITQEEMRQRRCLDLRRWYCLSRPQYQRSCGISSVISVWNYLFSTLGVGQLQPISQEQAIIKLGLAKQNGPHFNDIEFGQFSGNIALISWFKNLCRLYNVNGRGYYLWKHKGQNSTAGVDRHVALEKIKNGLLGEKHAFIYHAYDHYFCPVGYEITPNKGPEAYESIQNINMNDAQYWIIIAEPAKPYPFFTVRKWNDIAQDIELEYPKYTNIRKPEEGIKEYKNPYLNESSRHCIIAFERVEPKSKKDTQQILQEKQSKLNKNKEELHQQQIPQNSSQKYVYEQQEQKSQEQQQQQQQQQLQQKQKQEQDYEQDQEQELEKEQEQEQEKENENENEKEQEQEQDQEKLQEQEQEQEQQYEKEQVQEQGQQLHKESEQNEKQIRPDQISQIKAHDKQSKSNQFQNQQIKVDEILIYNQDFNHEQNQTQVHHINQ